MKVRHLEVFSQCIKDLECQYIIPGQKIFHCLLQQTGFNYLRGSPWFPILYRPMLLHNPTHIRQKTNEKIYLEFSSAGLAIQIF